MPRYQEDLFNESDVLDDLTLTQTVTDFEKTYFNQNEPHKPTTETDTQKQHSRSTDSSNESVVDDKTGLFLGCESECYGDSGTVAHSGEFTSEVVLSRTCKTPQTEGSRFVLDEQLEYYNKERSDGKKTG